MWQWLRSAVREQVAPAKSAGDRSKRGQSERGQSERGQSERGQSERGQSERGQSERGRTARGNDDTHPVRVWPQLVGAPGILSFRSGSARSGDEYLFFSIRLTGTTQEGLVFASSELAQAEQLLGPVRLEVMLRNGMVSCEINAAPSTRAPAGFFLPYPNQVQRTERRQLTRVTVNATGSIKTPGHPPQVILVENVSGGGASLRVDQAFAAGQELLLGFVTDTGDRFDMMHCRVTRCESLGDGAWRAGLSFLDLTEAEESSLVQMVFRAQVKLSRRVPD